MKHLLVAGHGDIARRFAMRLPASVELRAISRSRGSDLDRPATLHAFSGWADAVLHCAPPPAEGDTDPRTANLLDMLACGAAPARIVYLSTSGVYGDCGGARVDERRPVNPQSGRARRRVHAERQLEAWCAACGVALLVLRVPAIYAGDRLPIARLRAGTPALREEDDVWTNHVHADDLALIVQCAFAPDARAGVYNACDDSEMKMGDWLDLVARHCGLARPPRIPRSEAAARIEPGLLSFMRESRRLVNAKLKRELGVRLAYPTVADGLARLSACT